RETGQVVRLDRGDEFVRAHAREQCDAELWADTADGDEVDEQLALARRLEAVELQRVFFYVRVDAQLNFRTRIFEVVKGRKRNAHFIADTRHVDNHGSRLFGKQCAAQVCNHLRRSIILTATGSSE